MKCPTCGRKFPDPGPGVEFVLGDHLNYMQTAPCPGSGRRFVNAGGPHPPGDLGTLTYGLGSLGLALPALALWASQTPRHAGRRRYR